MSSKCTAGRAAGFTVVFAGLFVGLPRCFPAVVEDTRLAFIEADDGLTRESIPVLSRSDAAPHSTPAPHASATPVPHVAPTPAPHVAPTPAPRVTATPALSVAAPAPAPRSTPTPAPAAVPAGTPAPRYHSSRGKSHPQIVIRKHHRRWHHRAIARSEPHAAPARPARTRNWVVKFVSWWNGFADRRLHGIGHVPLHDA